MQRLKGKVIIITGGSGLLGKAVVGHLLSEGAIAINADINCETALEKGTLQCDITDVNSINEAINAVVEKYGKLDGLVNNAYPRTKDWGTKFENVPAESWKQNVDMQLNSYVMFCQAAAKAMRENKSGSIVNMSSVYGMVGPDFTVYDGTEMTMPAAYSAIKGGLINFTRYLASYIGMDNVRVNCVSPGGIFDNQNEVFVKNYEHKVPMKRMGKPEDIAPIISFLLSDEAGYITGQNIAVDGGWTSI